VNDNLNVPENQEELRLLLQKVSRRIRGNRGDEMISDSQLGVLFSLVIEGPKTPGELAAREHVSPPSMTRTVNELEKRGLVSRVPHTEDARKIEVLPTAAGETLAAETRRMRFEWFSRRLAELSDDERAALSASMPVLRRLAEES